MANPKLILKPGIQASLTLPEINFYRPLSIFAIDPGPQFSGVVECRWRVKDHRYKINYADHKNEDVLYWLEQYLDNQIQANQYPIVAIEAVRLYQAADKHLHDTILFVGRCVELVERVLAQHNTDSTNLHLSYQTYNHLWLIPRVGVLGQVFSLIPKALRDELKEVHSHKSSKDDMVVDVMQRLYGQPLPKQKRLEYPRVAQGHFPLIDKDGQPNPQINQAKQTDTLNLPLLGAKTAHFWQALALATATYVLIDWATVYRHNPTPKAQKDQQAALEQLNGYRYFNFDCYEIAPPVRSTRRQRGKQGQPELAV